MRSETGRLNEFHVNSENTNNENMDNECKRDQKYCATKGEYSSRLILNVSLRIIENRRKIRAPRSRWQSIVHESLIAVPCILYFTLHEVCKVCETARTTRSLTFFSAVLNVTPYYIKNRVILFN